VEVVVEAEVDGVVSEVVVAVKSLEEFDSDLFLFRLYLKLLMSSDTFNLDLRYCLGIFVEYFIGGYITSFLNTQLE